jgi:hypothetical protein
LMAQPLCSAIHSAPVNSGAKRHPAVVVNAVKRYKAASRVSKGKQLQIPCSRCSPSAHRFLLTTLVLALSLSSNAPSFLNGSYFDFRVNCPAIAMENGTGIQNVKSIFIVITL